jgi:Outer membrane protein beta-barrel domain
MKSISIFATLMILLTANYSEAQTTMGFTFGTSFAKETFKASSLSVNTKLKQGLTGGLYFDVPLSSGISLRPALNFVEKGYIIKDEGSQETMSLNYFEIPLNFVYHTNSFFAGAGPSFATGFTGKDKYVDKDNPLYNSKTDIEFRDKVEDNYVKPSDIGINIIAGYRLNGLLFTGNYNFGLSNINPDDSGAKIRNNYFAIKIGYEFGHEKRK